MAKSAQGGGRQDANTWKNARIKYPTSYSEGAH